MVLDHVVRLCDALVLLFKPMVEVVIHDLVSNEIAYINGELTPRKVGDPSLLQVNELGESIDKVIYSKLNFDGRLIKSISVPMSDKWLVCINCDISIFHQLHTLSQQFINSQDQGQPQGLFRNDWQEKFHVALHALINERNWSFSSLTNSQKKELIQILYSRGAFQERHATDYVSTILSMGRATVFKYLKEVRNHDNSSL